MSSRPLVTVCRACCCGSATKHPDVDHDAQLRELRAALGSAVRVSDCLETCEHSNVIVVSPSAEGRRHGGRPTWLGLVHSLDTLRDVVAWVRAGGPGRSDPPPALLLHAIAPPRGKAARSPETMAVTPRRPTAAPSRTVARPPGLYPPGVP